MVQAPPRIPQFTRLLAGLALSLLLAAPQAGLGQAPAEPVLQQARQLMAEHKAGQAYALLAPLEEAHAGEPAYDYLLGIAALDSGQPTRAIFALERVLAVQPDNTLARAEIGRAYLAAGEKDMARAQLQQVRAGAIPPAAVPAVDRLLNAIGQLEAQQVTQVRGHVDLGLGRDSNVNSATGNSQIAVPALGGLVFTLDPSSQRTADNFALVGGGLDVRVPLSPDLAFAGNLSASQTVNEHATRFDYGTVDGSAGLSKSVGAEVFSAALQAGTAQVGSARYRDVYGVLGQWQHNISPAAQSTLFAQGSRVSYPGDAVRNVDRWVLGAGFAYAFPAGPVAYVSGYAGREDALSSVAPQVGNRLAGVRAGLQMQFGAGALLFANVFAEDRDYGGPEPLFNRTRADRQVGAVLGVNYRLAPQWRLTPQISYTDNRSNVAIYEFTRTVASATLRREF